MTDVNELAIDFMCGFIGPFAGGATVVHQRSLRPEFINDSMERFEITLAFHRDAAVGRRGDDDARGLRLDLLVDRLALLVLDFLARDGRTGIARVVARGSRKCQAEAGGAADAR